ncbi:DUF397 domain-containing protein [Micromonospora sp.]|uniref:DUF397 domain-containing protein n=1 Tax=Micromonospora sp. TaxID=1876 RepID=UPI003B3BBFC1
MWRTSSRSGSEGDCVEVAAFTDAVAVRDSKDRPGPVLTFPPAAWTGFVAAASSGELRSRR